MKSFKKFTVNEKKDDREYDYEGDMAMTQLRSIIRNAQLMHDKLLSPTTNLPEWVQSKITLAEDYITTAVNYLSSELDEACWKGYKQLGVKKKDGKTVPNCVPVKEDAPANAVGVAPSNVAGTIGDPPVSRKKQKQIAAKNVPSEVQFTKLVRKALSSV